MRDRTCNRTGASGAGRRATPRAARYVRPSAMRVRLDRNKRRFQLTEKTQRFRWTQGRTLASRGNSTVGRISTRAAVVTSAIVMASAASDIAAVIGILRIAAKDMSLGVTAPIRERDIVAVITALRIVAKGMRSGVTATIVGSGPVGPTTASVLTPGNPALAISGAIPLKAGLHRVSTGCRRSSIARSCRAYARVS
jgi:hypothetical protein